MNSRTFRADEAAASSPFGPLTRWAATLFRGLADAAARPEAPSVQRIGRHATAAYVDLRGARIECLQGEVWVTLDGDCRDVILAVGQSMVVDRDSRVLVHALVEASMRISAGAK